MNKNKNEYTIQEILALENFCFDNPWSYESVKSQLSSNDNILIIKHSEKNEKAIGYALGRVLGGDCELYRIGVLPECRGNGIGKILLLKFISECRIKTGNNCDIFLEVRAKNQTAVSLYKNSGFIEIACRKGYYEDDDALIYKLYKQ